MRKQVKKIIVLAIIWILLIMSIIINKTYADDQDLKIAIETDKSSYLINDDIEIKIKLNKKVMTASFYCNYDSSILDYKEVKTGNLSVKNYPDDNIVRAIYADMTGTGIDEFVLVFKLKTEISNSTLVNITNATMTVSEDSKSYYNDQIQGIQNNAEIKKYVV